MAAPTMYLWFLVSLQAAQGGGDASKAEKGHKNPSPFEGEGKPVDQEGKEASQSNGILQNGLDDEKFR